MRIYRLCERDGRIDIGAYTAFREDVSLAEALEIEAALCVIGDQRAEYEDFASGYTDHGVSEAAPSIAGISQIPGREALESELEHRETKLTRARALMSRHRAAIAYAASGQDHDPRDRLAPPNARALEASLDTQRADIARIREALDK